MKATASPRRVPFGSLIGVVTMLLFFVLSIHTVVEKKLVGVVSPSEFGRVIFGLGAAITKLKYGIGGFVIEDDVWLALMRGGLSDRPLELDPLGTTFPANLADTALMQRALERARDLDVEPPANTPDASGRYRRLSGSQGNDLGVATYASLSFALFGFRLASLTIMYFAICACSLLLFALGHWRHEPAMLLGAAFMAALYLLIASPLIDVIGLDIKDSRFISTLGGIPILHLLLS